mmetsp:Transcript_102409/g.330338  ORF Transcript_102409/g.330338 Transcript_102409/m.330338 type:complete len:105 (-) Transcript_102409:560-874(-)
MRIEAFSLRARACEPPKGCTGAGWRELFVPVPAVQDVVEEACRPGKCEPTEQDGLGASDPPGGPRTVVSAAAAAQVGLSWAGPRGRNVGLSVAAESAPGPSLGW